MGQSITVHSKQVDAYYVFTTDRIIGGQDGERFESPEQAEAATTFPAQLAARLFESDDDIDSVYVASNDVIVGRIDGWSEPAVASASTTISDFYRFYQ